MSPARNTWRAAVWSSLALVLLRVSVSLWLRQRGFVSLSDDDYARVVIAQQFAHAPALDPSHTSWLPFPFWLYGTLMAVFGPTLACARAIGLISGVFAILFVARAGRWLGLTTGESTLGAALTCAVPYSAELGLTTTPDVLTAAMATLACASLVRGKTCFRAWGAAALVLASLSRYEAWAIVPLWALFVGYDALRSRRWAHAFLAVSVLIPPLMWMIHGAVQHHDAWFFVTRVARYRQALGHGASSALYLPSRLFVDAIELVVLSLFAYAATRVIHVGLKRRRWLRPCAATAGLTLFLAFGAWRDGAATHHVGRSLLLVWNLMALFAGSAIVVVITRVKWQHKLAALCIWVAVCAGATLLRPSLVTQEQFCPRVDETVIGQLARNRLGPNEKLAIDTVDYGYLAVQAGFARVWNTFVLRSHDPREHRPNDPLGSIESLRAALSGHGVTWLVAPITRRAIVATVAEITDQTPTIVLARIRPLAVPETGAQRR